MAPEPALGRMAGRHAAGRHAAGRHAAERWRAPTPPPDATGFAYAALALSLLVIAASWWAVFAVRALLARSGVLGMGSASVLLILAGAVLALLWPAWRGLGDARAARQASAQQDLVQARVLTAAARGWCWYSLGYSAAVGLLLLAVLFVIANDLAVGRTFFDLPLITSSFGLVLRAFWTNIYIFVIAEALVLVWGLVIAIARLMPGRAGQPIRLIATVYTDVFRGLPAIITIYLVGFGLPLTDLPLVGGWPQEWYAILALTLTYGAYVAEVYRSGIESIHWSQTSAARSLGLSYLQTQRFVVLPQAVRRIVPPLLNDFISLQKDTALVNVIGAIDGFNQAKIVASNHFNLSAVTTVALLFILVTIPQTRLVDRLLERDQRRMRAAG